MENQEMNKNRFIDLLSRVNREGINDLLSYLNTTDFYEAPASAQYHSAFKGGLCSHSLNVYDNLKKLNELYETNFDEDSMILVSLLHDISKTDFYEYIIRNQKQYCSDGRQYDDNGNFNWVQVGSYKIKDSKERPNVYSEHGVCSFFIVNKYLDLKDEEATAIINHHMDLDKTGYPRTDISEIYNRYPLAAMLHLADTLSTYITENSYIINE